MNTPMDIPATAPPETLEFCDVESSVEGSWVVGGNVTVVVANETTAVPESHVLLVDMLGPAVLGPAVLGPVVLAIVSQIVGARLMASLVPQQLEVAPQHQVSIPGHLDIRIFPLLSVPELYVKLAKAEIDLASYHSPDIPSGTGPFPNLLPSILLARRSSPCRHCQRPHHSGKVRWVNMYHRSGCC